MIVPLRRRRAARAAPRVTSSVAGSRPSSGDLGPCGRARAAAAFEPPCRRTAHAPRRARVSAAAWLP
ncbi:hypothetical protein AQ861_16560 [Burkholderia pseudomallei]|nr:hypothetical protein AQ861_16560 [Burkholderia pseudomallei]